MLISDNDKEDSVIDMSSTTYMTTNGDENNDSDQEEQEQEQKNNEDNEIFNNDEVNNPFTISSLETTSAMINSEQDDTDKLIQKE